MHGVKQYEKPAGRPEKNIKNERMEDFGDILFYIIAAVIAIAALIANKKKKTAQRPVPQYGMPDQEREIVIPGREEEINFPGTEERGAATQYEMIDQDSLQTVDSGFEDTRIQPSEDQVLRMGAEYEGSYSEPLAEEFAMEGISVIDESITQFEMGTKSELSPGKQNSWARNLVGDFDLAKAIVYSEIMRRKDFV